MDISDLKNKLNELADVESSDVCPIGRIIKELDTETADALLRVMKSPASTRDIHSTLVKAGYKLGRDTLSAHRKKHCRCAGALNEE